MFVQKNENQNTGKDRIIFLVGTVLAYFSVLLTVKMGLLNKYIGVILSIFLYMYLNFNLTNIFFSSRRTTFKIYIFMILEIIYFFMTAFTLANIFIYFVVLGILAYFMVMDEGRNELIRILRFISIYTIIKIIFTLTWIIF